MKNIDIKKGTPDRLMSDVGPPVLSMEMLSLIYDNDEKSQKMTRIGNVKEMLCEKATR